MTGLDSWLALEPELRDVWDALDESIERACAGAQYERLAFERTLRQIRRLPVIA